MTSASFVRRPSDFETIFCAITKTSPSSNLIRARRAAATISAARSSPSVNSGKPGIGRISTDPAARGSFLTEGECLTRLRMRAKREFMPSAMRLHSAGRASQRIVNGGHQTQFRLEMIACQPSRLLSDRDNTRSNSWFNERLNWTRTKTRHDGLRRAVRLVAWTCC